jgi:hypothetical protein
MIDPMTVAITAAIAGKAVEMTGEPAVQALAAIVRKVRDRFRGHPEEEAALAAVAAEPDSAERLTVLDEMLERAMAEDPQFGTELRELWQQVRMDVSAEQGGVVNIVSGKAEKVIQMRDVHGDLTIN